MKSPIPFFLGSFVVGAVLTLGGFRMLGSPSPSSADHVDHGRTSTSPGNQPTAAALARARLKDLAHDPYATLSDDEVSQLAAALDLTQDSNVALLNDVLNPALRTRLWKACLQLAAAVPKAKGGLGLEKLFKIASRASVGEKGFGELQAPLFDALRNDPDQKAVFAEAGSGLVVRYVNYWADHAESLEDAYAAIPAQFRGYPLKERINDARLRAHPDAAHFQERLDAFAKGQSSSFEIFVAETNLWSEDKYNALTPSEVIPLIGQLPPAKRNQVLSNIPTTRDDSVAMAAALSAMTSSGMQAAGINYFLYRNGGPYGNLDEIEGALKILPESPAVDSALKLLEHDRSTRVRQK